LRQFSLGLLEREGLPTVNDFHFCAPCKMAIVTTMFVSLALLADIVDKYTECTIAICTAIVSIRLVALVAPSTIDRRVMVAVMPGLALTAAEAGIPPA
jgi:hypothetical protein